MSTSQPMSFYSSVIHVLLPLSNPTTPNASQPRSRYYETEIAIPEANTIPYQLINTENIEAVLVSYIVDKYNQPKHGQLCTVSGRFFATNDKKNLLTINSYTANIFRSDLDYSSDIYQQSLPEPYSAIVTVIGKVHNPNELPNHSTISNKCRTFEVETAAYFNAKLNSFKCLVIMPTDLRFGSTPLPFKDTFVCCHAIIIGIDEETSHLAILLKDFTYLPTTSNESVKSQDSTTTPEKKVFQWGKRDKKVADSAVPSVPKHNFESLKQQKPILNRRIPTAISKINKLSENTKDTVQPIKAKSIPRKIYGTGRVSKSLKGNTPKAVTRITRNSVNLKDNLPSVEKEVGSNNENSDTELSDVLDLDSENIALDDCCTDTVENDDLDVAGNGNLHGNKLLDAGTGTENKSLRVHNEQALKE